ncbi:MAG: hypothetical protein QOE86_2706 [Solirubrobacteraceae bacterium]|jgi:DNA-binding NarL/FixJ family response regulator|nr:hypothetical protein [Solirubrobacteraceae bacterium]
MTATPADADLRGSVLLVDNCDIVHLGLRVLLHRQEWVTRILSARCGADAVLLATRHEPRVAVVDLFVGSEYGTEICSAIRARAPRVNVLLTSSSGTITQHAARAAGASGFIAKESPLTDLQAAIRTAAQDERRFVWRPEVMRGTLSARQQQILKLMAEGATNHTIGDALGLSVDTVKHHTTLIYRRLEVRNRAAAVHLAQQLGLLASPAVHGHHPPDQAADRVPQRRTAEATAQPPVPRAA